MFQRHSALIISDSEIPIPYMKISEQRQFSSEKRWIQKFWELKISAQQRGSPESALISSETALYSGDLWRIQNEIFCLNFDPTIFSNYWKSISISRHIILICCPQFSNRPQAWQKYKFLGFGTVMLLLAKLVEYSSKYFFFVPV